MSQHAWTTVQQEGEDVYVARYVTACLDYRGTTAGRTSCTCYSLSGLLYSRKEQLYILQLVWTTAGKSSCICYSLSGLQQEGAAVHVTACLDYSRKEQLYMLQHVWTTAGRSSCTCYSLSGL
jgi:hypothetical protein